MNKWNAAKRTASRPPLHVLLSLTLCLWPLAKGYAGSSDQPVFVAQIQNPNDYSLFANNGWDGNWYVGYNNGWIKQLPPIPAGTYSRAFIGAKLGRMKTLPPEGRPPMFNPIPGEIWMGISSTTAWNSSQRFYLTDTTDIPTEGSPEYALETTGESQWFWTEVPLAAVNLTGDNFAALWSPTPTLSSVSSAPIIAAGWGGKSVNSWVAKSIHGTPPEASHDATQTAISYFQPALALKLVPAGPATPLRVKIQGWQNGTPDHPRPILSASVEGENVERVWVEYRSNQRRGDVVSGRWSRIGRSLWKAPYTFSLDHQNLPHGKILLRVAAVNSREDQATSDPIEIEVSPLHDHH